MVTSIYASITETILQQIKVADPANFVCPWHRTGGNGLPTNALTRRPYRGINILSLWCGGHGAGYTDHRWATYRQWSELGAQVRRGEKGTPVIFYRDLDIGAPGPSRSHQEGTGRRPAAACERRRGICQTKVATPSDDTRSGDGHRFVARSSMVFNIAQVDGYEALDPEPSYPAMVDPTPRFDAFVAATGATIEVGGNRAAYVPATDIIRMPPRERFHSAEGYAATLAHELIHFTGAPDRLNRDLSVRFGSRAYAAEELVAELGSAFVLASLRLAATPSSNHSSYMASWLPLLRDDPRALVTAAAHASRATDYLLALTATTTSVTAEGKGA